MLERALCAIDKTTLCLNFATKRHVTKRRDGYTQSPSVQKNFDARAGRVARGTPGTSGGALEFPRRRSGYACCTKPPGVDRASLVHDA
jgi:hypothetical protein